MLTTSVIIIGCKEGEEGDVQRNANINNRSKLANLLQLVDFFPKNLFIHCL